MLLKTELQTMALSRLEDAEILFRNNRFDGAYYLAGYVVEYSLKSVIVELIPQRVTGFPSVREDFIILSNLKEHNFEKLLEFVMPNQDDRNLLKINIRKIGRLFQDGLQK